MAYSKDLELLNEVTELPVSGWNKIAATIFANSAVCTSETDGEKRPYRYVVSATERFPNDPKQFRIVKLGDGLARIGVAEFKGEEADRIAAILPQENS